VGALLALAVLLAELRLRRAALSGFLGGALGTVLGVFAALLVSLVVARTSESEPTKSFLEFAALFAFGYLGLVLGWGRGGELHPDSIGGMFTKNSAPEESMKLLDTSVLIDGRIADICEAQFMEDVLGDFPQGGELDQKLVELARRTGARIVTNDFNLNKVATVQGFSVMNVNQLANALKPVVLPGEPMRVLILREGKEPNRGVAYLDDGTMVVVWTARGG
jgi:uncharacterized protein YacL